MNISPLKISEDLVLSSFLERKDSILKTDRILFSFCGESALVKADEVTQEIETFLLNQGVSKKIVRAFFSILIEGLQNVRLHGEPVSKYERNAFVIVGHHKDYFLTTANMVRIDQVEKITSKIRTLNSLDYDQVKDHYMQILTEGSMSKKGGAGLGLITLYSKSKNKLEFEFKPVDDEYALFVLKTTLNTLSYEKNDLRRDA